jgi:hypothetical protein
MMDPQLHRQQQQNSGGSGAGKLSDSAFFDKLEQKVEMDVSKTWNNNGDAASNNNSESTPNNTAETTPPNNKKKQLVIIAGPQGSQTTQAIREFFVHHSSPYRPNQHAPSLAGWLWPKVDVTRLPVGYTSSTAHTNMDHAQLFDLLLMETDDTSTTSQPTIRPILLDAIEDAWQEATHGVVVGSDYLDQTPYSIQRIQDIVQRLQILNDDPNDLEVTVVLAYPRSRVEQWTHFYQTATTTHSTTSPTPTMSYTEWMCNPYLDGSHLERLESSMNPLALVSEFRRQDWNVVVLDEAGMGDHSQDPAQVVACRILSGTDCHDGRLVDVVNANPDLTTGDETSNALGRSSNALLHEQGLDSSQIQALEDMFQDRDCYYRYGLMHDDPGFRVLFKDALWNNHCLDGVEDQEYYADWVNVHTLWHELQAQVGCARKPSTPTIQGSVQHNQEESPPVSSSTSSSMTVVTVLISLFAVLVGVLRYRHFRRGQSREAKQQVLRLWTRKPSPTKTATSSSRRSPMSPSPFSPFSASTVSSSTVVLPPRHQYPFQDENIQTHHHDDEADEDTSWTNGEQQSGNRQLFLEEIDLSEERHDSSTSLTSDDDGGGGLLLI